MGVKITSNHRVEDLAAERDEGGFDAVFVAVGAHLSKRVDIPARDAGRSSTRSRSCAASPRRAPVIGRRVAVYGGGNTAMDAARVARRLGADEALIVYRRTREQMPAHAEEAEDAEREGVRINWLRTITAFDGPELQVELMELDESGYPQPTGRFETLAADTVILALGQETDTGFLRARAGRRVRARRHRAVSTRLMTGCPGVFAGGDMVPSERTVTVGVGHGKKAARHIDAWLRRRGRAERRPKHRRATFDKLQPVVLRRRRPPQQPELAPPSGSRASVRSSAACQRGGGDLRGRPVPVLRQLLRVRRLPRRVPGGRGDQARRRAPLPVRLRPCTGCGACFEQCPVHAIEMVPGAELMRATDRRQRGGRLGRLPAERGLLHLPDHAVVDDGRAGRRVVEPGARPTSGARCPTVVEMQSEGGAAGALHGALQAARWRRRSPRRRACC
jgi:thioredoxin reductase/ferredoxin